MVHLQLKEVSRLCRQWPKLSRNSPVKIMMLALMRAQDPAVVSKSAWTTRCSLMMRTQMWAMMMVAHCDAIHAAAYCPGIRTAHNLMQLILAKYNTATLTRLVSCILGANLTPRKVIWKHRLGIWYHLISATVRECFKTDILLGTINNPLQPSATCVEQDISEDGSGSGFACLCTSDLCNLKALNHIGGTNNNSRSPVSKPAPEAKHFDKKPVAKKLDEKFSKHPLPSSSTDSKQGNKLLNNC